MNPCGEGNCLNWNFDEEGGHCMLANPVCLKKLDSNKVRYFRLQERYTQTQFASLVGISRVALINIERGVNPRLKTAYKICSVLNKSITEVFPNGFLD